MSLPTLRRATAAHRQTLRAWLQRTKTALVLAAAAPVLGGCNYSVLDPQGPIGLDERSIIYLATGLMLIVVVPVIAMTLFFAWRYRASNTEATYSPDWEHSGKIELVIWLVPCIIVAILAVVTWESSHRLDPYRPIASAKKPIEVEVASLDWKWLFIYPDLGIATVNELAMPVGTPVHFKLTSSTVMNAFFVPSLGSQIYTMPGMQTQLSLLASHPGTFQGFSSNYSGAGFTKMFFETRAMSETDFQTWVQKVRASGKTLSLAAYRQLVKPSEADPVTYYSSVVPTLYHDILNQCTDGSTCMDAQHMAQHGKASHEGMAMTKPAPSSPAKGS